MSDGRLSDGTALDDVMTRVRGGIEDFRAGRMVILADDEDRENEGDVCIAASHCTPEAVNFMARHARGLICLAITPERARQLDLPLMVRDSENETPYGTAFTVSIEAREGVTTGISAADRARTIAVAMAAGARPSDLTRPGHVFPLVAKPGGVLRRTGQTEGSVDLARLAGLEPAAVICEIMNEIDHVDHVAFVRGEIRPGEATLVRVHSECLTGDAFGSLRCDCGEQLSAAMRMIEGAGKGVLLYMRQEGRGIGLKNKIRAYGLQDQEGLDTVQANERLGFAADLRDYGVGAQILHDLGVRKMRMITNNPGKRAGIEGYGLAIVDRVPLEVAPNEKNLDYLRTKKEKLGHVLHLMG